MVEVLQPLWPQMSLPGAERSLAELDAGGTSTAMISFPNSDIVTFEEARLVNLIEQCNDYAGELTRKQVGRYGLFASLPMPYIDSSLQEIERVSAGGHADGFLLISNYRNKWLGDEFFAPLMTELNRRKAAVFVHPNAADCCRGLLAGVSDSIIEYETDTKWGFAAQAYEGFWAATHGTFSVVPGPPEAPGATSQIAPVCRVRPGG
jgi:hypothetical protein